MPRGGARKGAGRKPGSSPLNTKTRAIAELAIAEGITPLEVMLRIMRTKLDEGDLLAAASVAKDAAPYIHPRLAAIEQSGPNGGAITTEVVYRWKHDEE